MTPTAPFAPPGRSDRGQTTSEYAVGTVGATCIACVLWQLGQAGDSSWLTDLFAPLREIGRWLDLQDVPWRARS